MMIIDLLIFIGLVSEKIGRRYFELKKLAPKLFNTKKFLKLHLNEASPEFTDKKHLLNSMHQFAGGNWPDIPVRLCFVSLACVPIGRLTRIFSRAYSPRPTLH
jgi:hypothetical protein